MRRWSATGSSCRISRKLLDSRTLRKILSCAGLDSRPRRDHSLMFRRRRQVTQETAALDPPPRQPLLWPWIDVSLGSGARPKRPVPDVFGQAEAEARHALVRAGFTVRTVDQPTNDPAEQGIVVKQKPVGGRKAAAGSQIVIYVGRLPAPTA
jgi:hypothetical protein